MATTKEKFKVLFYLILSLALMWGSAWMGHYCQTHWHTKFPWIFTWWIIPQFSGFGCSGAFFVWSVNKLTKTWKYQ
jgi:hypothetical protein